MVSFSISQLPIKPDGSPLGGLLFLMPLDGMRVVEISVSMPCRFAGMNLADWGADVIRVITPRDDKDEVPWDRRKTLVECDQNQLSDLVSRADLVLWEAGVAAIDTRWLKKANHHLRAVVLDHLVTGGSGRSETDASHAITGHHSCGSRRPESTGLSHCPGGLIWGRLSGFDGRPGGALLGP